MEQFSEVVSGRVGFALLANLWRPRRVRNPETFFGDFLEHHASCRGVMGYTPGPRLNVLLETIVQCWVKEDQAILVAARWPEQVELTWGFVPIGNSRLEALARRSGFSLQDATLAETH